MRSPIRVVAFALLALSGVTCTDGPTAPSRTGGPALVRIAPSFSLGAMQTFQALGEFGLTVDNIHIHIDHPPAAPFDTVIAVPAGAESLTLNLPVILNAPTEQLNIQIELRQGNEVLYSGTQTVLATVGTTTSTPTASVPISYVGPGASLAHFAIAPKDTAILITGTVPYRVIATDNSGASVLDVEIHWSVLDNSLGAFVGNSSTFQPSGTAGTTKVVAATINGINDTASVIISAPPTTLRLVSGDGQTGAVASPLAQPVVVQVQSASGSVVAGIVVHFAGTNGAVPNPASAVTGANGNAQTTVTLGSTAGSQTVTASVDGLSPVTATATATAGAAAQLALVSGNAQTDTVHAVLAQPFVVAVRDAFGNPVAGATVAWTRIAGAGTVSAATTTSDNAGQASVGYTLGSTAGADTVKATIAGVTGPSVTFTTTTRPAAHAIAPYAGNGQAGLVGSTLVDSLVARATDGSGHPVAGATIAWSIPAGGGSVSPLTSVTDAQGLAATSVTLPATAGVLSVQAELPNHTATTFTVTAQALVVGTLHFVVQPSNVVSAHYISPDIQVEVLDATGHRDTTGANANAVVALSVLHGPAGGHVRDSLGFHGDTAHAVRGLATFHVGNDLAGTYKLLASTPGVGPDSSAAYVVSIGPATQVHIIAGSVLTGSPGDTTDIRPSVQVTDEGGNAVPGASVTWTVDQGGGVVINPAAITQAAPALTLAADANGRSTVLWGLGSTTQQSLHANLTGGGADTAYFSLTIAAPAQQLAFTNAFNDTYASGTHVPLVVQLQDGNGNPVAQAGVPIGVYIDLGGGCNVAPPNRAPSASRAPASAAPAMPGSPARKSTSRLRSSAVPSGASRSSGCNRAANQAPSAARGAVGARVSRGLNRNRASGASHLVAPIGRPLQNAAPGVTGFWHDLPYPPDPTLIGDTVVVTDASGQAVFANLNIAGYAGEYFEVIAYDTTYESSLWTAYSPYLYLTPGPAYSIVAGYDSVQQAAGAHIVDYPIAVVLDSAGNGVPGATVTLSIGAGGGSLDSNHVQGDSWGNVDVPGWTLGSGSGLNTVLATAITAGPQNTATLMAVAHKPGAVRVDVYPPASITDSSIINPVLQVSVTDSLRLWDLNAGGVVITPSVFLLPSGQDATNPSLIGNTSSVSTAPDGSAGFTGLGVKGYLGSSVAVAFSAPGLIPDTTSQFTIVAGPAATMAPSYGEDLDSVHVVGATTRQIQVQLRDTSGFGVGGSSVQFTSSSASIPYCTFPNSGTTYTATSGSDGIASVDVTLPDSSASCVITATAYNQSAQVLSGGPIIFREIVQPAGYDVWMGAADTSWTNASNWSAGVPSSSTPVFIPFATTNAGLGESHPGLAASAAVGTLRMENAARLELHNQALQLYGNLEHSGTGATVWTAQSGGSGYVEMMTPGTNIAASVPYPLHIGDTGMACAGATPVTVSGLDSATTIEVDCPVAVTGGGTNWFTSRGDVNVQHHGTLTMSGSSNWLYVEGNLNITSDQSTNGLLTGGNIQVFHNFVQDTVAGAPASYKNFYSTGTSLLLENPSSSGAQTIQATSDSLQFWTLTAANPNGASVSLGASGATTYHVQSSLGVSSGLGVESFTIPVGVTLDAGYLSMGSTGRLYVNGTFNAASACDAGILAYIVLGANGVITPPSCHP